MKKRFFICLISILFLVINFQTVTAAFVQSTYDTDNEGWTPHLNDGAMVNHNATGGTPGGNISVTDITDDWAYLKAPSKFNLPDLYNGYLSFDLKINSDGTFPTIYNVRTAITGNGYTIINQSSLMPNLSWDKYGFTLNENTGWRIFTNLSQNYDSMAPIPSMDLMLEILENLDGLYIASDYNDGYWNIGALDQTSLDNVRLSQVPIPGAIWLLFTGLSSVFVLRKKTLPRNNKWGTLRK